MTFILLVFSDSDQVRKYFTRDPDPIRIRIQNIDRECLKYVKFHTGVRSLFRQIGKLLGHFKTASASLQIILHSLCAGKWRKEVTGLKLFCHIDIWIFYKKPWREWKLNLLAVLWPGFIESGSWSSISSERTPLNPNPIRIRIRNTAFLLDLEFCCMSVPICHDKIVHVWEGPECVPCVVYACPPCGVLVRARSVRDKAVSSRLSANLWCLTHCFPKGCMFHQSGLIKFRRHKNF